jgi:Trk-type K+ transport system membrane component
MIVKWLIDLVVELFGHVLSLLPDSLVQPADVQASIDTINSVLQSGSGLGAWIPYGQVFAAVSMLLGAIAIAIGIKVVRILLSLFTGGGGSAA